LLGRGLVVTLRDSDHKEDEKDRAEKTKPDRPLSEATSPLTFRIVYLFERKESKH
jgi:hypothetical protein